MSRSNNAAVGALVVLSVLLNINTVLAESDEAADQTEVIAETRNPSKGILPAIGVLLRLPDDWQLHDPTGPRPPDEYIPYERTFPLMAEELINKGYSLPLPIGLSLIAVGDDQDQDITDLNLVLGKGVIPPEDIELRPYPAVTIASGSDSQTIQIKADVWVLPFLNLYATVGEVRGDVDIVVNIDLADAPVICVPDPRPTLPGNPPRPPVCSDNTFSGSFLLPIQAEVDRTTATVGMLGAISIDKWFASLTASYTNSYGNKSSDTSTVNASFRTGRRFFLGNGHSVSSYFGVNYLEIDTRVQGVTTLADAFQDGDDLNVRYDIQLDNVDKYSGIAGLSFGFTNGIGLQLEWNKSARSERWLVAVEKRF